MKLGSVMVVYSGLTLKRGSDMMVGAGECNSVSKVHYGGKYFCSRDSRFRYDVRCW